MEEMDKLLKGMTQMKEGMSQIQEDLKHYVLTFVSEDGKVHVKISGDGTINELASNGANDAAIVAAINKANLKIKDYITTKMEEITPPEFREING